MPRPNLIPGRDPVSIVQEDGWAPVQTGQGRSGQERKISPPTGIRSPTRTVTGCKSFVGINFITSGLNNNVKESHLPQFYQFYLLHFCNIVMMVRIVGRSMSRICEINGYQNIYAVYQSDNYRRHLVDVPFVHTIH